MTAPDKVWAWCFQVSTDGDWGGWGGYARQTNLHPLDDRERATGAEYTRSDLIAQSPEIQDLMDALTLIADQHIPDQPASDPRSEFQWAYAKHSELRKIAIAAIARFTEKESK